MLTVQTLPECPSSRHLFLTKDKELFNKIKFMKHMHINILEHHKGKYIIVPVIEVGILLDDLGFTIINYYKPLV